MYRYGKEAESFDHNFLHFNCFEFMAQTTVEKVELVCSVFILDCSMVYDLISKKKASVFVELHRDDFFFRLVVWQLSRDFT